ncbi:hypothetical protein phiGM223_17 [Pseudomonas phage phiGM22-3]|uniref:Uncharacterized protein n=1 Tax=Pseudomonas phage phiGM22-3 TaxID=2816462 RepID=A0A8T8IVJ3_9CAUD|nr:hypothetical protein phiGM223_17 [Pseudomonas phage phiGM22-3]
MDLIRRMQHVLEALLLVSINVHVGGGAVRDMVLGLGKPKDLDVVMLAPDDDQIRQAVLVLGCIGYKPVSSFGLDGGWSGHQGQEFHADVEYAAENGDGTFDERWRVLIKFKHAVTGEELDLLCSHTDDVDELVGSYDYNINQYVLFPGDSVATFLGDDEGLLVKLRHDGVCLTRQHKMYQKALAAGWNIDEVPAALPL